ncbi:acyl-CoA thioester hydrolase [Pseudorhizobium tarimense]|uniref:Acyl-CoA thioester hydrolase n=1 Tax=Pseudorhizobium tarimense TaxID=1079109 RepID=A0ABV2H9Z2_9HYPH|nr:acyl-CoA thioesterase [Pseudorhizobium tarimense]
MKDAHSITFEYRPEIVPDDIDEMGHVNNAVYLRWVQETIVAYWKSIAPAEALSRYLWVALKHDITYRLPVFMHDEIRSLATATGMRGPRASFTTLIKRGEELAAEIRSSWCSIDAETRRPVRLPSDIVRRFLPSQSYLGRAALEEG